MAQAVNPADPEVRAHLDLNRPSAVLLVAILHFIVDQDRATGIVAGFRDRLAPGSFLVISHVADLPDTSERKERAAVTQAAAALYESLATQLFTLRTRHRTPPHPPTTNPAGLSRMASRDPVYWRAGVPAGYGAGRDRAGHADSPPTP